MAPRPLEHVHVPPRRGGHKRAHIPRAPTCSEGLESFEVARLSRGGARARVARAALAGQPPHHVHVPSPRGRNAGLHSAGRLLLPEPPQELKVPPRGDELARLLAGAQVDAQVSAGPLDARLGGDEGVHGRGRGWRAGHAEGLADEAEGEQVVGGEVRRDGGERGDARCPGCLRFSLAVAGLGAAHGAPAAAARRVPARAPRHVLGRRRLVPSEEHVREALVADLTPPKAQHNGERSHWPQASLSRVVREHVREVGAKDDGSPEARVLLAPRALRGLAQDGLETRRGGGGCRCGARLPWSGGGGRQTLTTRGHRGAWAAGR
mmetsp:Transcript_7829/g.23076  ORF Transcript_7829/g.23076 Transcript_7829/m.23076 type:complete len:321 (+) Transcript_7829:888-1850(+)